MKLASFLSLSLLFLLPACSSPPVPQVSVTPSLLVSETIVYPTLTAIIPPTVTPAPTSPPPFLPELQPITSANASRLQLFQTLPIPDFTNASVSQCSLAFSPDGSLLVGVCDNNRVPVWDVASGELRYNLLDEPDHEVAVTFSPGGSQIAVGGFSGQIRLYDSTTGVLNATFATLPSPIWDLVYIPGGDQLASTCFSYYVYLWDILNQQPLWSYRPEGSSQLMPSVDVHPDGEMIAFGTSSDGIYVLNAETGELITNLHVITPFGDVAFSPDGQLLAGGSDDDRIRIWSVANFDLLSTWYGHSGYVNGVAFTPDSKLLISGSHDRRVGIWEVGSGENLTFLSGHTQVVLRVTVNPAGTLIASISWDGTVRLWGVPGE